jgi:hypothetical protein
MDMSDMGGTQEEFEIMTAEVSGGRTGKWSVMRYGYTTV